MLNWSIWLAFLLELAVTLAVVPHRWTWIRTHPLQLAVVVLTPPYLPAVQRSLRALRLLRLARLATALRGVVPEEARAGRCLWAL